MAGLILPGRSGGELQILPAARSCLCQNYGLESENVTLIRSQGKGESGRERQETNSGLLLALKAVQMAHVYLCLSGRYIDVSVRRRVSLASGLLAAGG